MRHRYASLPRRLEMDEERHDSWHDAWGTRGYRRKGCYGSHCELRSLFLLSSGAANILCQRQVLWAHKDGFFAESKAMLPRSLIPVPDSVSDEEASIVEPVALALRVLDYMKPNLGDWVTIIGQGPIGLLMTQIALLKGCRVIAVDLEDYRLERSQNYGAEQL